MLQLSALCRLDSLVFGSHLAAFTQPLNLSTELLMSLNSELWSLDSLMKGTYEVGKSAQSISIRYVVLAREAHFCVICWV